MTPLWVYELDYPRWLRVWLAVSGVTMAVASVSAGWLGRPISAISVFGGTASLIIGLGVRRFRAVSAWYEVRHSEHVYHLRPVNAGSAPWVAARPRMDRTGLWLVAYVVVFFLVQRQVVSAASLIALMTVQLVTRWGYPRRRRPEAVLAWRDAYGRTHQGYLIQGWGLPVEDPPASRSGD